MHCEKCKRSLMPNEEWQKHQWQYHPSNDIEKAWAYHANTQFQYWSGSTYYESFGPYY